jgi:ABC-type phosphate transport system auxiliary subunit
MSIQPSTNATEGAVYRQAEATSQHLKGTGMNLPELMMAILMERSNILQKQVEDQMNDMQKRNEWLRDANAALAAMRVARPEKADSGAVSYGTFTNTKGEQVNVHDWMRSNKVEIETKGNDKIGIQAEFDAAIQNLKAAIDTANTNSQLDMVRLQGLMDKFNQNNDLLSNSLAKNAKPLETITNNIRG